MSTSSIPNEVRQQQRRMISVYKEAAKDDVSLVSFLDALRRDIVKALKELQEDK